MLLKIRRISFVNIKIPFGRQLYLESPEWRRGRREPELRGRWRTSSLVKDSVGHCTEEWGVWVLSQLYIQHPSIQVFKVLRRLQQPGPLSLTLIGWDHGVAIPALLGHQDTAQGTSFYSNNNYFFLAFKWSSNFFPYWPTSLLKDISYFFMP